MQNADEKYFIAPQNSTVEGYKIPRYTNDPFKECNSAPPTVTTTPFNSQLSLLKKKQSSLNGATNELWWESDNYVPKPRELKDGISIQNELQARLYKSQGSHVKNLEQTNLPPESFDIAPHKKNEHEHSDVQAQESYPKSRDNTSPIFPILYRLFKRLGWPCDGLLEGKFPKVDDKSIDTKIERHEDDGEFVYCMLRNPGSDHPVYEPYDLIPVEPNVILKQNLYYTVSASYVAKVCSDEGTILTPICDWLHEREMFYGIYKLPVFKNFRIWKAFKVWSLILKQQKKTTSSEKISDLLLISKASFHKALVEIRSQCEDIISSPTSSIELPNINHITVYALEEFYNIQLEQYRKVKEYLETFRVSVIVLVVDVIQSYFQEECQKIDQHIKNIQNQNNQEKQTKPRGSKNFKNIKEKYNIKDSQPPVKNYKKPSEVENSFKHVRGTLVKRVYKRMYHFVRLVDFLLMDLVRTLITRAVESLQFHIEASFNEITVSLAIPLHSYDFTLEKEERICSPMFKKSLVLKQEGDEESDSIVYINHLQPTHEEFETQMNGLIHTWESLTNIFQSFVKEPLIQECLRQAERSTNVVLEEFGEIGEWPNKSLLFGHDSKYQGCLVDIHEKISKAIQSVELYVKQFEIFHMMISSANFKDLEMSLRKDWTVEQFDAVLEQFNEQVYAMENMPVSQRKSMFLVETNAYQESCLPFPRNIINLVNEHLAKIATSKNEAFLKIIRQGERNLNATIKTVEEFVDHLTLLAKLADDIPKLEIQFHEIVKLFSTAFRYHSELTEEEKALYKTLAPSFHQLKSLVMYCEAKKESKIQSFSAQLDSIIEGFSKQLHQLANQIRNPALLDDDPSYDAMEAILYLKEDLQQLSDKAKNFAIYEDSFASALSSSKKNLTVHHMFNPKPVSKVVDLQNDLGVVEKDSMLRQMLWQSLKEWDELHQKWIQTPFSTLDVGLLQKEVTRFVQTIYLMEKGLPPNTLVPSLKRKVTIFRYAMPVVSSLRNPALKVRHWDEITRVIGVVLNGDKLLSLGRLLELEMFEHKDRISEISSQASNEATLELMLQKVIDYWKKTDLELLAHSSRDVAIITGIDDIMTALDDSMVTLANIRGSRFHLFLHAQVNDWDRKLNLFLRTFEEWVLVQRNWLYLETVFSAPDIQRQLPQEAKLFAHVDKNWRDIMRRAIDKPNALVAATSSGLLEILQGCNSTLEKIHHSLEDYLETKRLVFSRFYFLSNDELLDILANSKNVQQIQTYLPKCFFNIAQLLFDTTHRSPIPILAMISEEGEKMALPKSLRARGQVEQWLSNVEAAMFDTVKSELKKSIPELKDVDFMKWVYTQHGQIVLTSAQIWFANKVEDALGQFDDHLRGMSSIGENLKEKLDNLASVVLTESSPCKRNVIVSLMIILVYERDTVKNLINDGIKGPKDFQWIRQLRYYWDDKTNNCFMNQSIASFTYGYEYLGCTSRLVITPLTDRCFLTLTGAMHFHLGGSPTGPAGTGKSESVKDLAKALGKQCIVFNCSEGMDFKVIGRLLSGLAQSGSWCCLDEFNRIDLEVLSVIAQQMHVIRSAKLSRSIRFIFEGRDIRLNPTCGIFITMNPGYAGRQELPDNLKSLFRPVSMVKPDNVLIAEICLLSNGFTTASKLSQKLVNIYELCKKQLSKQDHYDFGLRAIKAVLIMAGEKNRNRKSTNSRESIEALEERILKQAINDSIQPKLISDDLTIFQQQLEDTFTMLFPMETEPSLIEKAIGIALRELSLQRWPSQIQKVLQFNSILNVRHGVMLVGPTSGGKTTIRKLLRHALFVYEGFARRDEQKEKTRSEVVSMVTINPRSLTLGELYGEFDANTAEWTDGILSYAVRNFTSSNIEQQSDKEDMLSPRERRQSIIAGDLKFIQGDKQYVKSNHQWIVFDGPVDTLWVENLNTVLDDTKLLCLSNGERISMLPSMKVIFEVDSLVNASPATISRCGMVYIDPQDLGWQPAVKSWLNKLRTIKINEEQRNYLWSLFESTIEPGLEFLHQHQASRFTDIPDLSVVMMLCNILDAFLHYLHKEGGFDVDDNLDEDDESLSDEQDKASDNTLIDFSALMFNFGGVNGEGVGGSANKKSKQRFFIQQQPDNIEPFLCRIFIFSYTWAFGGHFNCLDEEAEEIDKFCHIPSFDGLDNVFIRHNFDSFVRRLFENSINTILPPNSHLIYSYYVDFEKGNFMVWDHLVLNATLSNENDNNQDQRQHSNLIPTPSTLAYSFLISLLTLHGMPVLLGGNAGLGKTTLINDVLHKLSQPGGTNASSNSILGAVLHPRSIKKANDVNLIFQDLLSKSSDFDEKVLISPLTFSALTTLDRPKNAMLSKLSKRARDAYGTRHGEKVIMFIDDMTMPKADEFGVQPPLETLRDLLVYGGFFNMKELQWKNVYNLTLLAACGAGQKESLQKNKRLIQKFSTLCLPHPSAQALHHVYYTKLSRVIDPIDFTPEVIALRSGIVSTLLGVFYQLSMKLKTIPAKSHYMFNIRDITKVVTGILQANASVIRTRDQFIELFVHESSRIFLDRLINDEDRTIYNLVLMDQVHDFLKTKWAKERLTTNRCLFGDFMEVNLTKEKRIYQSIRDERKLLNTIEDYYDRACVSGLDIPSKIVLFPLYCQHIVMSTCVLRQPGSHLLIIGMGGTGKKSVVQLASYMQFCEFYHPTVSKYYGIADFKEDIKKVMVKAGVNGTKMTLFLNDRNIVQESFLEYISNLMSGSEYSTFFDAEAKENIAVKLRSDTSVSGGLDDDSVESIFQLFRNRVRQNLHVVFSTSAYTERFHERCRLYPGLINYSTVCWFDNWPSDALYTVADTFLLEEKSNEEIPFPKDFLDILVHAHSAASQMCARFLNELGRHYHVTPKSFLDFILLFKKIYSNKSEQSKYKLNRLKAGLSKLEDTNASVMKMQDELISLGPILEQKTKATEDLMVEIEQDREQVDKVRAVVKREQEVTNFETKKVESVAFEAQKDLDAALPQLEAATAALDTLNKYDIGEIRSYANPPTMVMTVMSAVCVILSEKPDWPTARLLLADPGFLKKLINYDYNNMDDKIYTRVKKYTQKSDFNPNAVGKISFACKSLCTWVLALVHYTAVNKMVRPKQEKCREAQEALARAQKNLASKEASLKKVEDQLKTLEERYRESVDQLEEVKSNKALTIKRLETAAILINALTSEKDRWAESITILQSDSRFLLSESFMTAAASAYLGPFPPVYRSTFMENLITKMKENDEIQVREGFQLSTSVVGQIQIQDWLNSGLPHDHHSIENALFIQTTQHWPFIIDPQHQAFRWIKSMERESTVKIVDASSKTLVQVLESSIRLGEVVVIQNATTSLDPSLDPILKKSVTKRGNQSILVLGDSEIEYNHHFRLYILTNEKNPKALPELCIKVMIVNFLVTTEGITDQILSKIVQQENPELENQRNTILRTLVQDKNNLTDLEDTTLNLLHDSQGSLLDNDRLIQTLENSKNTAFEIKKRVAAAEKTEIELEEKRRVYLPLAKRGSLLYFVAADLSALDWTYQFSLAWFMNMFCKCISTPLQSNVVNENRPTSARKRLNEAQEFALLSSIEHRKKTLLYSMGTRTNTSFINTMLQVVTETFYRLVSYALAAKHQLLFSFYLTCKILMDKKESLTMEEYGTLVGHEEFLKQNKIFSDKAKVLSQYSLKSLASSLSATSLSSQTEEGHSPGFNDFLTPLQWEAVEKLSEVLTCFTGLINHVRIHTELWKGFMESEAPYKYLENNNGQVDGEQDGTFFQLSNLTNFQLLFIIRTLKPDYFVEAVSSFVISTTGREFVTPSVFDLKDLYAESNCRVPVMFILAPGADPSSDLLRFVKEVRGSALHLDMISLGRSQGKKAANAIRRAYKQKGSWVFLQNCHLALSFMLQLEEIVRELSDLETSVNPHFRLWLSSKPDPSLPASILLSSLMATVETPPDVKNNLQKSFAANVGGVISEALFEDMTIHPHWKQLVYGACFFHAVVQGRRKFGSYGWNSPYDFITPDLEMAIQTIQTMLSESNEVKFGALEIVTGDIIYGGRVLDSWDKRCLNTLFKQFFCKQVFQEDFTYFNSKTHRPPTNDSTFLDCVTMIDNLPSVDPPQIFGMNENVVYAFKVKEGEQLLEELSSIHTKSHLVGVSLSVGKSEDLVVKHAEEILRYLPKNLQIKTHISQKQSRMTSGRLSRVSTVKSNNDLRKMLDKELTGIRPTSPTVENSIMSLPQCETPLVTVSSPIAIVLKQEHQRFDNLLFIVTSTLTSLCDAMKGDVLFNDQLEELAKSISQNKIPQLWLQHSYCTNKTLSSWIADFRQRIHFITRWLEAIQVNDVTISPPPRAVWLPALFYPQGTLTAVLQAYARKLGVGTDTLTLRHEVMTTIHEDGGQPSLIAFKGECEEEENGIIVFGLFIDGAAWDVKKNSIIKCHAGARAQPLPEIRFMPHSLSEVLNEDGMFYECPLYQTSRRSDTSVCHFSEFVTSIMLPTLPPHSPEQWVLNGVAAICQTND